MGSISVEVLIRKEPDELLRSLDDVKRDDASFNWDLLREAAGTRAVAAIGREEKKAWAAVALRAADEGRAEGLIDADTAVHGVVVLKAKLIAQLGAELGDPILDLGTLLAWFAEEVRGLDVEAEWPPGSSPIEDLRSARRVKNDLVALSPVIADQRYLHAPGMEQVRRWWDRREELP